MNCSSRKRFKADDFVCSSIDRHCLSIKRRLCHSGHKQSSGWFLRNIDKLETETIGDVETMDIDSQGSSDGAIPLPYHSLATGNSSRDWQLMPRIDESNSGDAKLMDRFIKLVDELDNRVEKLRKDAIALQEKKDYLSMSMDLLKNNDMLSNLEEYEREEITCYMQRVGSRLATVELNVKTVRNTAQEECLHQVNVLIDSLIASPDAVISRQRCQMFLNACEGTQDSAPGSSREPVDLPTDKKFESSLLGCTLDDQKTIKKRLYALITYLNKQTITD